MEKTLKIKHLANNDELGSSPHPDKLGKLPKISDNYRSHRREIKCLETGIIYQSTKEAADLLGVTPALITHVLKGRQKRAKGFTFVYTGNVTRVHKRKKKQRTVRDDAGRVYMSVKELADAKGIAPHRARYVLDKHGVFPNEWLTKNAPSRRVVISGQYCLDGLYVGPVRRDLLRHTTHLPRIKVHQAVDKGLPIALYIGKTGWEFDSSDDLFAPIGVK